MVVTQVTGGLSLDDHPDGGDCTGDGGGEGHNGREDGGGGSGDNPSRDGQLTGEYSGPKLRKETCAGGTDKGSEM